MSMSREEHKGIIRLIEEYSGKFGIDRLVEITSLDVLNIPVAIAVRSKGKTVSVSAGKGLTIDAALVSAGMEAIECEVAERRIIGGISEHYKEDGELEWLGEKYLPYLRFAVRDSLEEPAVEFIGYKSGVRVLVPESITRLKIRSFDSSCNRLAWSSNGLASGVSVSGAILSGLYEVIERDAISATRYLSRRHPRNVIAIDSASIEYASTRSLLKRIKLAGLKILLLEMHGSFSIPVFKCILYGQDAGVKVALGYGSNLNQEVAMNRAITEAVQTRTCFISGAREDLITSKYVDEGLLRDLESAKIFFEYLKEDQPRVFRDTKQELNFLVETLLQKGWQEPLVYVFDDTGPFSIVRVILPDALPISFSQMTYKHYRLNKDLRIRKGSFEQIMDQLVIRNDF